MLQKRVSSMLVGMGELCLQVRVAKSNFTLQGAQHTHTQSLAMSKRCSWKTARGCQMPDALQFVDEPQLDMCVLHRDTCEVRCTMRVRRKPLAVMQSAPMLLPQ